MKNHKKILVFLTFALCIPLFLISCRKDDENDPNAGNNSSSSSYHLTAKIDGNDYKSYVEPTAIFTTAAGMLILQSSDSNGNSIQFQIPNFNGKGTYVSGNNDLSKGYINFMKMVSMTNIQSYTSVRGNGTVEVTEISDTHIKGTFSATAYLNTSGSNEKVEITSGSFMAKLQKQ